MKKHQFKLISAEDQQPFFDMARDKYPIIGESLTVLNFPVVERYVIEWLEPRADHWTHDRFERMALIVRKDKVLQTAAARDNVVAFDPNAHIATRLTKIEKIARRTIDDKLTLEMSHADFAALSQWSGLEGALSDYDILAYHGIPLKVGEAGAEWNASTAFHGFSDDAHVLYVTLPGGLPFVMNPTILEAVKAFYERRLTTDQALAVVISASAVAVVDDGAAVSRDLREMFSLIGEGLMPIYDAAQEITRMTGRHDGRLRRERAFLH
jgi:hypothetical protein